MAHAGHAAQARERSSGAGSTPLYSSCILPLLSDPLSPGPACPRSCPYARNTTMSGGAVRTTISRRHARNNNASPYTRPSAKKSSVRGSISYLGAYPHGSLIWLIGLECHKFPQLSQSFYFIAFRTRTQFTTSGGRGCITVSGSRPGGACFPASFR